MIKVKRGVLRCGFCHGDAQGLLEACQGCSVLLHADCRRDLGRCCTLGCEAPSVQSAAISIQVAREGTTPPAAQNTRQGPNPARGGLRFWRRNWRTLVPAGVFVALVSFCLLGVSTSSHCGTRSRAAVLRSHACAVRAASFNFKADHRRWPASIEELTQGEHYFDRDSFAYDLVFVTRNREVWIAYELEYKGTGFPTIGLLDLLYELEPEKSPLGPDSNSTPPAKDY